MLLRLSLCALFAGSSVGCARACPEPSPLTPPAATSPSGNVLLTIFLRHDQSKTLDEINDALGKAGFKEKFPPSGIEVVSWYVMMGIGQVVTLRVPAERVREVNLAIEHSAWGAYRTEFYLTYDYKAVAEADRRKPETK
jgi:hypothetical protein